MFARLVTMAPWWAKPLVWIIAVPFRVIGWVLKEMSKQVVSGAKRTFAPLLWPVVGGLGLVALYGALGPHFFQSILTAFLALGFMFYGLKVMVFGFSKSKKKKK